MPTTEIPPWSPVPPPRFVPRPDGGDLYDARRWESAYREIHDAPILLLQLQDDLSRARQREAFWISVLVHLFVIILIISQPNLAKYLGKYLGRRVVVMVKPSDPARQRELTYLELPPDAQKLPKPPDANVISDKDRIATSRAPQLDREELKKILDSARPGAPGPSGPREQPAPPPPMTAQTAPAPPQSAPVASQDQMARLQSPPAKPTFDSRGMSAGSAIEQAARAAMANRGAYGNGGDFGLGLGRQPVKAIGELDVLSDTMGVDFSPYLARVLHDVRENWYRIIPESARAPLMKKGRVAIEFAILKDGSVAGLTLAGSSGDVALDRAAWGGITASNPFPALPNEFGGKYLALRFHFYYNPDEAELR